MNKKTLTPYCQSGRSLAGVLLALASAAIPALCGAQAVSWAHQNGSLQSNGSITIKSLSGGSYAGSVNPAGAVAKANQNAVTQPPTVIIQATASSTPIMMFTATQYSGNLGGVAGADAKCAAEFGSGWKFAEIGKIVTGVSMSTVGQAYINDATVNACSSWTSNTGSNDTRLGVSSSVWTSIGSVNCSIARRLACINF